MRYKNISDQELTIIGVGVFKAGEVKELDQVIENSHIQIVDRVAEVPKQPEIKEPVSIS